MGLGFEDNIVYAYYGDAETQIIVWTIENECLIFLYWEEFANSKVVIILFIYGVNNNDDNLTHLFNFSRRGGLSPRGLWRQIPRDVTGSCAQDATSMCQVRQDQGRG